jgi:hypothetical protein
MRVQEPASNSLARPLKPPHEFKDNAAVTTHPTSTAAHPTSTAATTTHPTSTAASSPASAAKKQGNTSPAKPLKRGFLVSSTSYEKGIPTPVHTSTATYNDQRGTPSAATKKVPNNSAPSTEKLRGEGESLLSTHVQQQRLGTQIRATSASCAEVMESSRAIAMSSASTSQDVAHNCDGERREAFSGLIVERRAAGTSSSPAFDGNLKTLRLDKVESWQNLGRDGTLSESADRGAIVGVTIRGSAHRIEAAPVENLDILRITSSQVDAQNEQANVKKSSKFKLQRLQQALN